MRVRKKKHTDERLNLCSEYFFDDKNKNLDLYKNIFLEIGCGKGDFICTMAQQNSDKYFIAVEKIKDIAVIAIEKAKALNLNNIKFLICDIKDFKTELKFDAIYLNFSDPWKKRWQYKNRLTHENYLEVYKKILKPDSKIILKTDNFDFFEYSLKSLADNNFNIIYQTKDLYAEPKNLVDNIQTEYEKKFIEQNIKICKLIAEKKTGG